MKNELPVFHFVKQYQEQKQARFHMPGHKADAQPMAWMGDALGYDITEVAGADCLLEASGIIGSSEETAAALFDAKATCYSTQGSTLCIQAMTALAAQRGKTILAGRNAHGAFVNACTLLRINIVWILAESTDTYGIRSGITPRQVERLLRQYPDAAAVYLTSPDYLGHTADIAGISTVCRDAGILLLCDNAHGAYMKFSPCGGHPLENGADLCCDSAHKTLPVLTGGAYLHLGASCPWDKDSVKSAMGLFASTSPSYLILSALDCCNQYLKQHAAQDYTRLKQRLNALRLRLEELGIPLLAESADFAKIVIDAWAMGLSGTQLAEFLRGCQVECEYANDCYTVLMVSPFNSERELHQLESALRQTERKEAHPYRPAPYLLPEVVFQPFETLGKPTVTVPLSEAEHRISSQTIASCPPGVPVVIAGERIHKQIKNILENSGNRLIKVIK